MLYYKGRFSKYSYMALKLDVYPMDFSACRELQAKTRRHEFLSLVPLLDIS